MRLRSGGVKRNIGAERRKHGKQAAHSKIAARWKIFFEVMKISLDKLVKYGKLCTVEKCNWLRTSSGAFCFWGDVQK
jgi:hypothetical protein